MKIQIKSPEVEVHRGLAKRTNQPYEMRKQSAFLLEGDEVRRFEVTLGRDQSPYAPGFYTIDAQSFEIDGYKNLRIGRLNLSPEKAGPMRAA